MLGEERSYTELRIPNFNLFPSMPPLSPQSSLEAPFSKYDDPFCCKRESGRILWGSCHCWNCENNLDLEKKSSEEKAEDVCYDKMNFLFPSDTDFGMKDNLFDKGSHLRGFEDELPIQAQEDFFTIPDLNYFRDTFLDDLPRNQGVNKRERLIPRKRDTTRSFPSLSDDDDDYVLPKSFDSRSPMSLKPTKKRRVNGTRYKYAEAAKKRKFNIMEHYSKGNRSRSETGYLGIRISTSGRRFRATVNYLGKPQNVGTFDSPEQAAMHYDKKLLELSGWHIDKNRLNFSDRWDLKTKCLLTGHEHFHKRTCE